MTEDDKQADGLRPKNPLPTDDPPMAQTNSADTGGTVNAVQGGNQIVNNFLGPDARQLFTQWERGLRRSPGTLSIAPNHALKMEREAPLAYLTDALSAALVGEVLLVRGEPGVGKTALVLRSIDELRGRSRQVLVATVSAMSPHAGGLEELIHTLMDNDGASGASAPHGILILDGAEAAQEALGDLVAEAVSAARSAGFTAVLVSRDDAVDTLRYVLDRAGCTDIHDVTVPSLDDREIAEILASAPQLGRLADDPRSRWLLRRLALVDLLLRSTGRGAALPTVLLSEAEVYTHVWFAFVLNNQRMTNGVVPEDRGIVLVSLAEGRMTGRREPSLPGPALASLRSDGILAPLGEASATSNEEHAFAHDVLRDYATTKRLLLDDGLSLLAVHGPRWAVRAGRIFCQVRLWSGSDKAGGFATRWSQVRQQFRELAAVHGSRWNEVPWEAVLSAGWCSDALVALTEDLLRQPELVRELLRCLTLRFGENGICDPVVAAPVVAWLVEHTAVFTNHRGEQCDHLVVAWLRSVSQLEVQGGDVSDHRPVRVLIRDSMLRSVPEFPTPAFIEALALLGTDRDDAANALLRHLAYEHTQTLMPAVDRPTAARCLAATNATLLAELAAAYYAPPASQRRRRGRARRCSMGEHEYLGIRLRGQAAWWRGPFFPLLQTNPKLGMELIGTLLAAAMRPESRDRSWGGDSSGSEEDLPPALRGDFLGIGDRNYSGPYDAWAWYRGALTGPQPCMSALMALDQWLDRQIHDGVTSARKAAELVLRHVELVTGS
ncbi:ATP-binding protein [Streptomyces sp. NPDC048269]|uniref:ATP-binding protein n=1 Tax=Streptomyces sp. NPDC048269 TaxID=3155753 RepID=UPI003426007B